MAEPKKRVSLTLYFPQDEYEKLIDLAKKADRKFANYLTRLIRRALEELPL